MTASAPGFDNAPSSTARSGHALLHPLLRVLACELSQLAGFLKGLESATYRMSPVGEFESSIGGHVRHCLDHIVALLDGAGSGVMSYDDRARCTDVENDRTAALSAIAGLQRRVSLLGAVDLARPISLSALLTKSGPTVTVVTSLGRELAYVLSHTTHHNAIIAAMAKTLAVKLPEDFGVAASTAAFRERARCAR
jgi:uncharacterized damage-inducible protein DinB